MANFNNTKSNTIIAGTSGNDYIFNDWRGSKVSIDGGSGNDTIYSNAYNVTVKSGAGNDRISLAATNNLIQYANGDGNDTIWGFNESDTLTITSGSYSTQTSGNDIIVTVGNGKIILKNAKDKSLNINKTATPKLITLTDDDKELFRNNLANVTLKASSSNDSIDNDGANMTIDGGAGNDTIRNWGAKVSLNGGIGNDSLLTFNSANVTLDGGAGDDYFYSNDTTSSVKTYGSDGNDELHTRGKNNSLFGGNGNDNLNGNYLSESILSDGGAGNDSIWNYGNDSTLLGGEGDDTIVTVYGVWNNDSYHYDVSKNMSLDGGKGKDLISVGGGENITAVVGADNDTIYNGGVNVTIIGGKGDDSIFNNGSNAGTVHIYNNGDGNDTITNFRVHDTIVVPDATWSITKDNSNVTVKIGNGSILLPGTATLPTVNVVSSTEGIRPINVIENTVLNAWINGTSYKDYIFNRDTGSGVTINASTGDDTVRSDGNNASINVGVGDDSVYNFGSNVTIDGGAGNDTFWN